MKSRQLMRVGFDAAQGFKMCASCGRGVAFVDFENDYVAGMALSAAQGKTIGGKPIRPIRPSLNAGLVHLYNNCINAQSVLHKLSNIFISFGSNRLTVTQYRQALARVRGQPARQCHLLVA